MRGRRRPWAVMSSVATSNKRLSGKDRGARCVVLVGWAKGERGVILGPTRHWDGTGFTVQLDSGPRFLSKPGEVGPFPAATPFRRAVAAAHGAGESCGPWERLDVPDTEDSHG